ncbi:hypothetical protein ABVK25_003569 [Lepraria finkii]|uniref:Uncharacterized protein n=1 Tax=Lepraria finkii TaxID=1340010 RepID=A0ABR4BDK5_9LECA
MAAVSTYTSGRGYSSQRPQDSEASPWDFNSPGDQQAEQSQSFPSRNQPPQQKLNFNPPQHQSNGSSQPQNQLTTPDRSEPSSSHGATQGQSKSSANIDPSYLSPYKQGTRLGFNESRDGSEADSLIDLYGHPRSIGERSLRGSSMDKGEQPALQDESLDDEDPERSRWIHRDKLALIESHEMQEAGIKLSPPQLRSNSRSKGRREQDQRREAPEMPSQDIEPPVVKERKKQRARSPIRQEEDEEETVLHDFDLRTPEEIAVENYMVSPTSPAYRQPDLRKSSSRIPLPRSSPMPIPQEHIERDTPLPRKRGASGNWTGEENGIAYNRVRSRGNSTGSQVLLDDPDTSFNTPTPASRPGSQGSPTKSRLPSNNRPTTTRKISSNTRTPDTQQKPRTTSTTTSPRTPPVTRPKSRSGLEPRPPTAINRPDGDPPWLATMYKPDPRLPPDQQLLPTHAKRLQQEQWERAQKEAEQRRLEGKASPQLPREFSPLAEHTVNGLQPPSRDHDEQTMQEQRGPEWPLTVATPGHNPNQKPSPSPSATEGGHAGYSTILRVKEQSPVGQAGKSRPLDPFEKERMARDEQNGRREERKKEEGCGCCIVM